MSVGEHVHRAALRRRLARGRHRGERVAVRVDVVGEQGGRARGARIERRRGQGAIEIAPGERVGAHRPADQHQVRIEDVGEREAVGAATRVRDRDPVADLLAGRNGAGDRVPGRRTVHLERGERGRRGREAREDERRRRPFDAADAKSDRADLRQARRTRGAGRRGELGEIDEQLEERAPGRQRARGARDVGRVLIDGEQEPGAGTRGVEAEAEAALRRGRGQVDAAEAGRVHVQRIHVAVPDQQRLAARVGGRRGDRQRQHAAGHAHGSRSRAAEVEDPQAAVETEDVGAGRGRGRSAAGRVGERRLRGREVVDHDLAGQQRRRGEQRGAGEQGGDRGPGAHGTVELHCDVLPLSKPSRKSSDDGRR